jgi:hypothetical protein
MFSEPFNHILSTAPKRTNHDRQGGRNCAKDTCGFMTALVQRINPSHAKQRGVKGELSGTAFFAAGITSSKSSFVPVRSITET